MEALLLSAPFVALPALFESLPAHSEAVPAPLEAFPDPSRTLPAQFDAPYTPFEAGLLQSRGPLKKTRPVPSRGMNGTARDWPA